MESYEFFIKTEKKHIDFINKVIEAYDGLGVVRTLNANEGLVKIITLNYYIEDLKVILNDLNNRDVNIEILELKKWEGLL